MRFLLGAKWARAGGSWNVASRVAAQDEEGWEGKVVAPRHLATARCVLFFLDFVA